jgi:dipeptidyl aminopeptidase/acylaminoacyl peptidase
MVYVRTEGFTTVMCERSLHASSAVALDPGEGVVHYPRWLNEKRVAYGFSAPQRPFGFLVQDNLADADRTPVTLPGTPSLTGQVLQHPQPFEFEVGPEEMFSGMLYKTQGVAGKVPAIVYLPDGPLATRRGEFQMQEQALASTALTVLTPVIHGASGFGAPIEDDLREFAGTELEVSDLAEVGRALGKEEGIAPDKLSLVGKGFGGTLALLTAGARPGVYATIVAIDPITDWSIELGNCDVAWRNWVTDRFGMPLTDADHYALRTPSTFSAVIDAPLLLVRTPNAPEYRRVQMDMFIQDLDENGVKYEVYETDQDTLPGTLREISKRLARTFLGGAEHAEIVSDLNAADL